MDRVKINTDRGSEMRFCGQTKTPKRGPMKKQLETFGVPDVLVPIRLDAPEESIEKIRWLHERFGITRFCPDGMSKGHRAEHYPPREEYEEEAERFARVREYAESIGCTCGWFCNLTVKSGPSFTPIVRGDGTSHPFANCPTDEAFSQTLAENIAAFAAVARPAFIFLEDDFSISAANGCFCEKHLAEFAKRQGKHYTREALLCVLAKNTPEALALNRAWQALKKDTLVALAKRIRAEMDRVCPTIPIGLMQSGVQDRDGDFTEAVAKALAGERHTPFVRLYGTFYCGFETKKMPVALYHALYCTQHLSEDILRYHESDTYPHNRFLPPASRSALCAVRRIPTAWSARSISLSNILTVPLRRMPTAKPSSRKERGSKRWQNTRKNAAPLA